MAFHGFGKTSPKVRRTADYGGDSWCTDSDDVCVFIGGLLPKAERACFLRKLYDTFTNEVGPLEAVIEGGEVVEYRTPAAALVSPCASNDCQAVRLRLADSDRDRPDTLGGNYRDNIVNWFTSKVLEPEPWITVEEGLTFLPHDGHGVQYEQSSRAREEHYTVIAIATADAFKSILAGNLSQCTLPVN